MADVIRPSTAYRADILLQDDGDFVTLETGVLSTAVTIRYAKPGDNTLTTVSDKSSWTELGSGLYRFTFTSAQVGSAEGLFVFIVTATGILPYPGKAQIVTVPNNISITDVQTALTNQGYTTGRAPNLDNLDASIDLVITTIGALNDLDATAVEAAAQAALTAQGYTVVRAALLDNLDAAISSVSGEPQKVASVVAAIRESAAYFRIFLQLNGQLDSTGTAARITIYNEDGSTAIAEQTDNTPDALGMFSIEVDPHGLSASTNYMAKVEVDIPGPETVSSWQGFSTA